MPLRNFSITFGLRGDYGLKHQKAVVDIAEDIVGVYICG